MEGDADARATARVLRTCPGSSRQPDRRDGDRSQARRAVLVPAHARAGLRVRAARDDAHKIRKLELLAGAPPQKGRHGIAGGKSKAVFDAERELSRQAEAAYRRLVNDWQAARPPRAGAGATSGAHQISPRRAKPHGRPQAPDVCASLRQSPAPNPEDPKPRTDPPLDFLSARVPGVGRWRPTQPVGSRAGDGLTH
jgi:hypothetical protein